MSEREIEERLQKTIINLHAVVTDLEFIDGPVGGYKIECRLRYIIEELAQQECKIKKLLP